MNIDIILEVTSKTPRPHTRFAFLISVNEFASAFQDRRDFVTDRRTQLIKSITIDSQGYMW